jgi:hypothetical protein
MLEFYAHLLHILMEQKKKATEEDYRKIVGTLWDIDGWALDYRVFDEKWKKICEALDIKPQFDNKDENNISGKNIEIIAARLYRGRHVFQQYAEQAERSKKISDEIDKDPKYNY